MKKITLLLLLLFSFKVPAVDFESHGIDVEYKTIDEGRFALHTLNIVCIDGYKWLITKTNRSINAVQMKDGWSMTIKCTNTYGTIISYGE